MYVGEIVVDCDDLNLEVKPTLLPEKQQGQMGLFAKSLFLPKQIICQVRGPILKREHLPKLLLASSDILVGTFDSQLIHCNTICRFANDIVSLPQSLSQFKSLNHKSLRPFKWQPNLKYNARFTMKNMTENKVFLEAISTIHSGQEIYVKHDADVWVQKMRSRWVQEERDKEMGELAEKVKNMNGVS